MSANAAYLFDQRRLKAVDFTPSGNEVDQRSMPTGGLVVGDWFAGLVARGYGFHVNIGAFSTPITGGGAGTIIDLDQPEGIISIPKGTTLIPLRVAVQCQIPLAATDSDESEILLAVDPTHTWFRDGTKTDETAFNMRTDGPGCPCICASAFSADMTVDGTNDLILDIELAHKVKIADMNGTPANAMWNDLDMLYEPLRPPFIVGPACLVLYFGGTVATTGFAEIDFAAIPSAWMTGLV